MTSFFLKCRIRPRFFGITFAASAALLTATPVAAQIDAGMSGEDHDPLTMVVGGDISQDSNLFRQPSSARLTSDTITTAYVGLRLDKQYSLQRFQADITGTTRSYDRTSQLNSDSLDYRGAWLWQVGSRFSGTLSADRRESQVPFENTVVPISTNRNLRVSESRAASIDALIGSDWHLLLGAYQTSQTSDQAVEIQPDFEAVSQEVGVRYAPSTGSSISAIQRSTSGDYVGQSSSALLGSGYQQNESEIRVSWIASGKSTLNGRLTWFERTQDGAAQRNFSGTGAELSYAWAFSEKLKLHFVAKRDLTPFQDISASHIINDTLSVNSVWRITERTAAHLLLAYTTSDFTGAAIGPATGPARHDTLKLSEIGVDWSPLNRLILGLSALYQVRDSTAPAFSFDNTIFRITASWRF